MGETAPGAGASVIVRLTREEAMALAVGVLERHGYAPEEARTIANHLVEAELRGHSTTGLVRLKPIVQMAARGRQPIRIVREGPAFAQIDGGGNPGSLSGEHAVRLAITKARANGFAVVALFNSAQAGICGHYVRLAAEAGLVGALFPSSHGRVAPHGGIDPVIGTNPIAFGFPGARGPIVIDAATSILTNGDVDEARRLDEALPAGAALDAAGAPTRDPDAAMAGALLPIAGHKGYAIGLAMQLFGMLAGGDAMPENRGNFGFFFLVVDPAMFGPPEDFATRVGELTDAIKRSRRADAGEEIRLPGEGGDRRREATLGDGIAIARATLDELERL